jgi:hypothetical protein
VGAVELAGEDLELLECSVVVGLSPRPAQASLDSGTVTLGEVSHHVALFVAVMPTSA